MTMLSVLSNNQKRLKFLGESELYINSKKRNTPNVNFYGWLVKVISSKSIIFFCYHIFQEKNLLIDFLLKKKLTTTPC